jgi:hypothetical protein
MLAKVYQAPWRRLTLHREHVRSYRSGVAYRSLSPNCRSFYDQSKKTRASTSRRSHANP